MSLQPTVLIVTAELWPLAKTGGLGDMVYSIATSLRDSGFKVQVVIPGYRSVLQAIGSGAEHRGTLLALGHDVDLLSHRRDGMEIIVLGCATLFDRPGNIYLENYRKAWSDNASRFGVLSKAAASIVNGATAIDVPDLVHIQDWHAALTPAYLRPGVDIPVVLTIQNFMFQGRFGNEVAAELELAQDAKLLEASQLFGGFSFLQAGLALSTALTTTSNSYVEEIAQRNRHNWFYLRDHDLARLRGITNWPEYDVWNPASDPVIAARYDERSLDRRVANRRDLESRLGWAESQAPMLCTLSRVTKAKGFRFLLRQADDLLERGCRLVFVGDGEPSLLNAVRNLAGAHPGSVALISPYSEDNARRVLSAADMLLMPSLTEPCGLSQQHAQIYGCVPIVSMAGGIPDTVREGDTGFLFQPSNRASFLGALDRALQLFREPGWRDIQCRSMRAHIASLGRTGYADLFRQLIRRAEDQRLYASQNDRVAALS